MSFCRSLSVSVCLSVGLSVCRSVCVCASVGSTRVCALQTFSHLYTSTHNAHYYTPSGSKYVHKYVSERRNTHKERLP